MNVVEKADKVGVITPPYCGGLRRCRGSMCLALLKSMPLVKEVDEVISTAGGGWLEGC